MIRGCFVLSATLDMQILLDFVLSAALGIHKLFEKMLTVMNLYCPNKIEGFPFHMQYTGYFQLLLSIYTREWFLKYKDVRWIYSVRFCMTEL